MKRSSLLIMSAVALLAAPVSFGAGFTLEWDAADPSYGNVEYTVEKSNENDSPISWSAVGTTTSPVMGFSSNPLPGDQYRLRITNTDNGVSTIDPNIVKPHPPQSLNFRLKDTTTASIDFDNSDQLFAYNWQPSSGPASLLAPIETDSDGDLAALFDFCPTPAPLLAAG